MLGSPESNRDDVNAILKWAMMKQGPAVIDLFAGAGGLSVGATTAGCIVRASVEIDTAACDTLRLNGDFHGKVLKADVCDLTGGVLRSLAGLGAKDPLIIVGGAPCQPFSKAAYWVEDGDEARFRRERSAGKKVSRPAPPTEVRPDHRRDLVHEFWRTRCGGAGRRFPLRECSKHKASTQPPGSRCLQARRG